MIRAALALFALDGDRVFLARAEAWFEAAKRHHFIDAAAAYNLAADDAPALIATPLSLTDEATPAATGTMAANAATLFMLTGNGAYREHAERILTHLATDAARDVVGTASLQSALRHAASRTARIRGRGGGGRRRSPLQSARRGRPRALHRAGFSGDASRRPPGRRQEADAWPGRTLPLRCYSLSAGDRGAR